MIRPLVQDGTPATASALGVADRFRYWRGASGRRYLFSAMPQEAVADLTDVVVLVATETPRSGARAAWVGEIDAAGHRRGRAVADVRGRDTRVFVHFLARGDRERHAILDDLTEAA